MTTAPPRLIRPRPPPTRTRCRSSPPNSSDSNLCTALAFNAVHGAFAGRTGFTVGTLDNASVFLPITLISTLPPRTVDINGRFYARLCVTTGQPNLA